ncbi:MULTISPECIES: phage/plasmid primase, P4 family [unclassified Microbacterium]|uniref:phage/plasmid primase, P4 family n=1 Tax=unclassified Microbacterium TaxID=2609290 RepID=UPI00041682CF|nr:phage/plasmid primase, P4 family [Microbacterium sp. B24]
MQTLSDLLDRLGGVEETPDGYLATCPAHADSHASLRVTTGDKGNVLVACRAGCKTPDVMAALGMTMRDLARLGVGDDVPKAKRATAALPATPAAIASLAMRLDGYAAALIGNPLAGESPVAEAYAYASDRFGLAPEDMTRLGLGYVDDIGGGPRLVVPFRTPEGVARNFQARALEADAAVRWQGPKSPEGGSWSPLGWFPGESGWPEVLVCEGPGDALTGAALGYDTIGIAGASRVGNPAIIDEVAAWIGDREAVVAGDGDPAGRRFSATLAKGLADRDIRVRVLNVGDGLDLTDWRAQNPGAFAREVIRAIAAAEPVESKAAALLAWDESRYSLTDLGGARYLRDYVESIDSGVRYTPEAGFLLLDGGVWRPDERQAIRTHAQKVADIVKRLAIEAAVMAKSASEDDQAPKKRAARFQRYAAHVQTTRGIDSMLRELQAVQGVPAVLDDFDRHPDLMAVRNGVLDLRTGELQPHDPTLLLTRRLDFDYDPKAKATRWEGFLGEVFPDEPGMPAYIRRLIGYGITGHTVDQCFAVLWGTGANGKSVLTDTLTEVFREFTVTTPFSTFEERPSGGIPNDLAALKGARLVMASEGEAGKRMAEAVLKRVTGRDLIAARFMRKEFFEFRPTFLLLLATNNKPQFRGQDEGLWRRVKMLPFVRYFAPDERDTRLGQKLLDERQGILAWAVRGAIEWYAQGLGDPASVTAATKEYREQSDVLEGFLPGEFAADPEAQIEATVLFRAFQEYADEHNHRDLKGWSSRAFYGALGERGFPKRKTRGKWVIDGIRRSRAVDRIAESELDEDVPKLARAASAPLAASPSVPTIKGVDLNDVI